MPNLVETPVRENVRVFTLGGDTIPSSYGANCTAVEGRDATLVIDPLIAPAHARLVAAALRERKAPPVRFVVLTHHHTDHALGSSFFASLGATVFGHERCRDGMKTEHPELIAARRLDPALADLFADAASVAPAVCFSESVTLDLGGVEVRVVHPGHGHTSGDAIVNLPGESVAVCGDLVSNGYHVNFEHASIDGVTRGLERLLALGARTYLPGHGAAGGREIVEAQMRYVTTVREAVRQGRGGGKSSGEILDGIRTVFPGYLLEIVLPDTVRRFSEPE